MMQQMRRMARAKSPPGSTQAVDDPATLLASISDAAAPGLIVGDIEPDSALFRLGVRPGNRLLAIDGLVPRDVIDLQLELPAARSIHIERPNGERIALQVDEPLDAAALSLADPVPGGIRECNNHCEFCFIRGLPSGLRETLYVFDDDYRYSFLWGNFLTLTNLNEDDWARLGYQKLTPLNVSVHATDPDVRRVLLNNRHAPAVLPQLSRLASLGIEINAQVVLCAGINDLAVLDRTITELAALYPAVRSLSVVPVGLTRYSRVKNIRRPTSDEARQTVEQCEGWQTALRRTLGVGFVYPSDELYLLAGRDEVPSLAAYDGAPVLSNGVGLLRTMLDEWQLLLNRTPGAVPGRRSVAWLTGRLAAPALERMADAWQTYAGWRPRVEIVENTFFGDGVTVSGLLTGQDLMAALRALPRDVEDVVLPRGPFGFDGRTTLDGVSAEAVGAAHGGRVHLASTPRELLEVLRDLG
jgi:putative radical SAM enzyme (TIGR03279 family)